LELNLFFKTVKQKKKKQKNGRGGKKRGTSLPKKGAE